METPFPPKNEGKKNEMRSLVPPGIKIHTTY